MSRRGSFLWRWTRIYRSSSVGPFGYMPLLVGHAAGFAGSFFFFARHFKNVSNWIPARVQMNTAYLMKLEPASAGRSPTTLPKILFDFHVRKRMPGRPIL